MTLIVFLDERNIYPAYIISFRNNKIVKLFEDRHPITQDGSFRGGHLGLRHYDVAAREFLGSYRIPLSI